MKKIFTLLLFAFACIVSNAQTIPNADFSTYWPSNPGQPNGWTDSEDISQVSPGSGISGWAAQGYKSANTYPAFITSSAGLGFPISTAYTHFNLNYKFANAGTDIMTITVTIYNAANTQIGSGMWQTSTSTTTPSGVFTPLSIPINYQGSGVARAIISVLINSAGGLNPTVGTNFIIDDLSFSTGTVGINDAEEESKVLRIFPNPAQGFANIKMGGDEKITQLQLIDMNGRLLRQLDESEISGNDITLPLSGLPAGNYSVAVKNNQTIQTKTLVIE